MRTSAGESPREPLRLETTATELSLPHDRLARKRFCFHRRLRKRFCFHRKLHRKRLCFHRKCPEPLQIALEPLNLALKTLPLPLRQHTDARQVGGEQPSPTTTTTTTTTATTTTATTYGWLGPARRTTRHLPTHSAVTSGEGWLPPLTSPRQAKRHGADRTT